ncbi:MAG: LacI family DNA-binding transcriptional regulator [Nocardioides sp.]|uniref:LacI family DNA-binding transcriptional regulator n=1 Tax=Nocardioides sp. TaxID=35761 RepID=UPI0039E4DA7D
MAVRRVTLGDVAREAGVSLGTASEALSGSGRMTETTRTLVREAAQRLGYRANALARGLRTGRTRAIGLHVLNAADNFDNEYFREFVAGVADVAVEHDYDLNLLSSNPDRRRVVSPQVDGIILPDPLATDVRAIELLDSGIPLVAGERLPPGMPASPVIGIDHETALARLLDHAYAAGARRPVLLAADEQSGWGVVLRDVFARWCAEHDVDGIHTPSPFENGRFLVVGEEMVGSLLTRHVDVDLLIVPGEHAARAALRLIAEAGRRVGRDIMLAACADAHLHEVLDPPVTALNLTPRLLGATCAEALIRHLDHGTVIEEVTLLPAELVTRASTAPLAADCRL